MTTEASDLTITRLIKAPPAVVWKAWTTPEHLAKWWIPAPLECRVVKLDVRPGGGFETLMREGDGPFEPHVQGCFLEAAPEARLAFTTLRGRGRRHPLFRPRPAQEPRRRAQARRDGLPGGLGRGAGPVERRGEPAELVPPSVAG